MDLNAPFNSLYEGRHEFKVDIAHIMENIRDQYNLPLEHVLVIENMDNCIDEPGYTRVEFVTGHERLTMKMIGTGIPADNFFNKMPEIAGTTKKERPGLGHYGWGMKAGLWLASPIKITTRKDDFIGIMEWYLEGERPEYSATSSDERTTGLKENMTVVEHVLKGEVQGYYTKEKVKEILTSYYPTLLNGTKVLGRAIEVYVDGERARWTEPPCDKSTPIKNVEAKEGAVTGHLYYKQDGYDEKTGITFNGEMGVAIIVHGRMIKTDYFGQMTTKVTGYVHADILEKHITADKTTIRPSPLFYEIKKKIGSKIDAFLKEVGEEKKSTVDSELIRFLNKEINSVVKNFADYFSEFSGGLVTNSTATIANPLGSTPTALGPGGLGHTTKHHISGGGTAGGTINPTSGTNPDVTASQSDPKGNTPGKNIQRRQRFGVSVNVLEDTDKGESWYTFKQGVLSVFVSSGYATYKRAQAENRKVLEYHCLRGALDALTKFIAQEKKSSTDIATFFKHREELLEKWCEAWEKAQQGSQSS